MNGKRFVCCNILIFLLALFIRLLFSPNINFETDSFSVLLSSRNILENGEYLMPLVSLDDNIGYNRYTGWGVGYPFILSVVFFVFGYGELVARWFTIIMCSSIAPIVAVLAAQFHSRKAGIISALLIAINPLLVCLSGRILTANMGFVFLTYSISFVLLATLDKDENVFFVGFKDLVSSVKRRTLLYLSFFFYGCTLCTRDDYLMFAPVFVYILLNVMAKSRKQHEHIDLKNYIKAVVFSLMFAAAGFLPSIYYNYKNYGKIFTSSHREYGASLSLVYLLKGSAAALGLPGWLVILSTVLVFLFPVISLLLLKIKTQSAKILTSIIVLLLLPIIIVCGSFFVASTGASPRYIIPLVPFVLVATAILLVRHDTTLRITRFGFIVALFIWHFVLYYPPTLMFKIYSKTLYLTQYSPWYNKNNYFNYPHPIVTTLDWVNKNTPANAIILSDYNNYHYYFYTKRDIMGRDDIEEINRYIDSRPIYLVEDHRMVTDPNLIRKWREELIDNSIDIKEENSISIFSPVNIDGQLKIYRLVRLSHQHHQM